MGPAAESSLSGRTLGQIGFTLGGFFTITNIPAAFYNVDNAGFVRGNSLQLVDGIHTVQFYSVDQSGNREAIQTRTFKIDSTAPIGSG